MSTKGFEHKDDEWKHTFGHEIESKQEILIWFKSGAGMYYLDQEGNVFSGMVGSTIKQLPQVM